MCTCNNNLSSAPGYKLIGIQPPRTRSENEPAAEATHPSQQPPQLHPPRPSSRRRPIQDPFGIHQPGGPPWSWRHQVIGPSWGDVEAVESMGIPRYAATVGKNWLPKDGIDDRRTAGRVASSDQCQGEDEGNQPTVLLRYHRHRVGAAQRIDCSP